MANEKPEIELSKLTPEQVKKLEGELTGLIGGAHSMSSERIATMVTQGHSSHLDETSARPTAPAGARPPAPASATPTGGSHFGTADRPGELPQP